MSFIQLNRQFQKIGPEVDTEQVSLESYSAEIGGLESSIGWSELLVQPLSVVLGEPGSGKSEEFVEICRALRSEDEFAFCVRLDELIAESLDQILNSDDLASFNQWKASKATAVFLMDSVDEAKLRQTTDFARALRRFQGSIGRQRLARARVIVSSRISEWRPIADANNVREILGSRAPKREAATEDGGITELDEPEVQLAIYLIEPLDRSRVKTLVEHLGVVDSDDFLIALDRNHAWMFARRPIDVIGLVGYWRQHRALGSLAELVDFDVEQKLRESEDRRNADPLTAEMARQGAETLAAAASLCRKLTFRILEDGVIDDGIALDASMCLPTDWTPQQQNALLGRAVFDSESYGRIRFHHRQVLEYLASSWFATRMHRGCTLRALKEVLFADESGQLVVRPSLAPIAAWLASGNEVWNVHIRRWILESAPWLHFRYGDPGSLPVDYKAEILRALVRRFGDRRHVWIDLDAEAMARLADPRLSTEVSLMITDRALPDDLRADMLSFVRFGRLDGCLGAALEVIESNDDSDSLRSYAAVAFRDIASEPQLVRLGQAVEGAVRLENSYCAHLCEALFPRVIDAQGLVSLLRKSERVVRHTIDLEWYLERHLEEVLTPALCEDMLQALINLSREEPHVRRGPQVITISEKFSWLGGSIEAILIRYLQLNPLSERQAELAADALWMLGNFDRVSLDGRDPHAKLREAARTVPHVRQLYFWKLIDNWRARNPGTPIWTHRAYGTYAVLRPQPDDVHWLVADALNANGDQERTIALTIALELMRDLKVAWRDRLQLMARLLTNPTTRGQFVRLARDDVAIPLQRLWYRFVSPAFGELWWQRFGRKVGKFRQEVRERFLLTTRIHKLTSGKNYVWLANLVREAAEDGKQDRWAPTRWDGLVKRRGRLITWATKQGCARSWRTFTPTLPHERPEPLRTDVRIAVGLAGLNLELGGKHLQQDSLTEAEVLLAIRYSVNELNGFANWTSELASVFPAAVKTQLLECVDGEWLIPAGAPHVHEVLARVVWHEDDLGRLIAPEILDRIGVRDPQNAEILHQALTLVVRNLQNERDRLSALARVRVNEYAESARGFLLWMSVWLQCDAREALEQLRGRLQATREPHELMTNLCSELGGDRLGRQPLVEKPDYTLPRNFRELISLVFEYVKPADDIEHEGGYSPGPRDHAQQFRNSLLEKLAASADPGTESALAALASDPVMVAHRDWINHLIEQRRIRLADDLPWSPADVRQFEVEYEHDPRNEVQLFEIARRRLMDVKDDLETSDDSPRNELRADQHEGELRAWLARRLNHRSLNRYVIPQEEEIERGHPDLRFQRPGIGPVSVEIKWAHRWTATELLERLENQLVGQYMRANNSRCGLYVIGHIVERAWPYGDRRLNFDELMNLLEDRAAELRASHADIRALQVISLSFLPT